MAKLSANGCHKVAAVVFDVTDADAKERGERCEITFALRSDGKVLRRIDFVRPMYDGSSYRQSGNYSVTSYTVRDESNRNHDWFVDAIRGRFAVHYGQPVRTS